MSLMLLRSCRCRQDNAGAILNLTIRVQLPCQFPIGPSFLHKDDGITLVNQDRTTLFSVSGKCNKKRGESNLRKQTPLTVSRADKRVISMEFLRWFLRRYFAGKPLVASRNGVCFPRLRRKTFLRPQAWLDL
ncbi:hypothetical protein ABFA07_017186 [Porites harrisoni]